MPYIMNALSTPVNTQAQGTWLQWKPLEIKTIHNEHKAAFFEEKRSNEGLIRIPEEIMELEKNDPVRINFIEEKRKEGVSNRIKKLQEVQYNLEVSLRRDLEVKNIKADALTFASKGELVAYQELMSLQSDQRNVVVTPGDEIRKLKEQSEGPISGNTTSTQPGTPDTRRADTAKPAASGKQ